MKISFNAVLSIIILLILIPVAGTQAGLPDSLSAQNVCLSISLDKTGSFSNSQCMPDSQWFDQMIDAVTVPISHVGFQLIVNNADRRFIRQTFRLIQIDLTNLHLSERILAKAWNDSVTQEYNARKCEYIRKCLELIKATPTSNSTDLTSAIERAARFHGEPAYRGWNHVAVFISDVKNTNEFGPSVEPAAQILVAGATYKDVHKQFRNAICLESHVAIPENIKSSFDSLEACVPVFQLMNSK